MPLVVQAGFGGQCADVAVHRTARPLTRSSACRETGPCRRLDLGRISWGREAGALYALAVLAPLGGSGLQLTRDVDARRLLLGVLLQRCSTSAQSWKVIDADIHARWSRSTLSPISCRGMLSSGQAHRRALRHAWPPFVSRTGQYGGLFAAHEASDQLRQTYSVSNTDRISYDPWRSWGAISLGSDGVKCFHGESLVPLCGTPFSLASNGTLKKGPALFLYSGVRLALSRSCEARKPFRTESRGPAFPPSASSAFGVGKARSRRSVGIGVPFPFGLSEEL